MLARHRSVLSVVTRLVAIAFAVAAAALTVGCVMLAYAAATFEHDSLPGPVVLSMVAVGVGLAAVLCAGVTHVLWRLSNRQVAPGRPTGDVDLQ